MSEERSPQALNRTRIAVVIPCYRVRDRVLAVISRVDSSVSTIHVVDDGCPQGTGRFVEAVNRDPRVRVHFNLKNQGVGSAVLVGVDAALSDGADIIVKIDGDGQMDPALLPLFTRPIIAEQADLTKGNRFYNPEQVKAMPLIRIFGNVILSFLAKLSTGYWNIFDPTNGYIAVDSRLLAAIPRHKLSSRYFFETDLLFRSGILQAKVLDVPMRSIYAEEESNLKIRQQIRPFIVGHIRNIMKRIFYSYFLRDFNIASLELICGIALSSFGAIFAIANWGVDAPATAGTVMIAALPLLTGIFLLVSFVNYDIQQVPREPVSPRLVGYGRDERAVVNVNSHVHPAEAPPDTSLEASTRRQNDPTGDHQQPGRVEGRYTLSEQRNPGNRHEDEV